MTAARLKSIAEIIASIVSLWVVLGAVGGGIWFFVDNEFTDKLAKLSGAERTAVQIEILTKEMTASRAEFNARMDSFEERLDRMSFNNKVFEVDMIRSLVWDDCPTEGQCRYTWRTRRTNQGQRCVLTDTNRFVIDRFGITHPVSGVEPSKEARKDGEWTELSNAFNLPESVPTGVAEFYMELTYHECFEDDPTRKVREVSPKLTFQINPRTR